MSFLETHRIGKNQPILWERRTEPNPYTGMRSFIITRMRLLVSDSFTNRWDTFQIQPVCYFETNGPWFGSLLSDAGKALKVSLEEAVSSSASQHCSAKCSSKQNKLMCNMKDSKFVLSHIPVFCLHISWWDQDTWMTLYPPYEPAPSHQERASSNCPQLQKRAFLIVYPHPTPNCGTPCQEKLVSDPITVSCSGGM